MCKVPYWKLPLLFKNLEEIWADEICRMPCYIFTRSKSGPWSNECVKKSQIDDRDIKPILELNESFSRWFEWQDISTLQTLPLDGIRYFGMSSILKMAYYVLNESPLMEEICGDSFCLQDQESLISWRNYAVANRTSLRVMKSLQKATEWFYWYNARKDIEKWCQSCDASVARKGT